MSKPQSLCTTKFSWPPYKKNKCICMYCKPSILYSHCASIMVHSKSIQMPVMLPFYAKMFKKYYFFNLHSISHIITEKKSRNV